MDNAVVSLIGTYHELNAAVVDELQEMPSPLQFHRFVAKNRPFVVRGGASDWEAVQAWDAEYLRLGMAEEKIKVAVTPRG